MRELKYSGFRFTRERYADNFDFYRRCLMHPAFAKSVGVTAKDAQEQLDIMKRFSPKKEHVRLSAHKVDVYAVHNPVLQKRGRLVIPQGSLESVFSIDFGTEIEQICKDELKGGEKLGPHTIDLGDGTIVKGMRIRKSIYPGPQNNRTIPNQYLDINYDSSHYEKWGEFQYSFDIKRNAITSRQPIECRIESYVLIDGQNVLKKSEVARAAFKPYEDDGTTPAKFSHIAYTTR